jgi:hypothetical protein
VLCNFADELIYAAVLLVATSVGFRWRGVVGADFSSVPVRTMDEILGTYR